MSSIRKKAELTVDELSLALAAAQQTIWTLNSTLEASIKERARLLDLLNEKQSPDIQKLEESLLKANQEIWELNSRIEVHIRERDRLIYRYNCPLRKIIAERIRNKLRHIREKIKTKKKL